MEGTNNILDLKSALDLIGPAYRKKCEKTWTYFTRRMEKSYDEAPPSESDFITYFMWLRNEKNSASSSLWVYYSHINTVMKNRYGCKMQMFPRITTLIKGYDTDIKRKAPVFDTEHIEKFIEHPDNSPYWLVRKVGKVKL